MIIGKLTRAETHDSCSLPGSGDHDTAVHQPNDPCLLVLEASNDRREDGNVDFLGAL